MKFNKKRPIHTKTNKLFYFSTMILLCIVIFLSVGFSAFQNDLSVENISANCTNRQGYKSYESRC